jgi:predicted transcriptional regulator
MLLKICQYEWLIQHLLCSNNYSDKITGKSKNPFTIRVIDDVFILYSFYSFVESISKLDVISIILKNSDKSCRFQEIYPKLQAHLTMSQLMKFIFELKKYDLLISLGDESNYIITPKGMQYLQIHEELTNQINSANTRNLGTFNSYSWLE